MSSDNAEGAVMTPGEAKGWTVETALEHMTALIASNQQRTDDGIRSLRELIDERDKRWPTRDEIRKEFNVLEEKIANLRESRSAATGVTANQHGTKVERREDWRLLFAGLALLIAIAALFLQVVI